MKNVDTIIGELNNLGFDKLHPSIPLRDIKILKNVSNLMSNDSYITENQGNLVLKILKENLEYLDKTNLDIATILKFPTWSKKFRVNEKIRKVTIEELEKGKLSIKIEYSFDKEIKKVISFLNKHISSDGFFGNLKNQYYTLTEKNIVTIHDTLTTLKFTFSPYFLELYNKINEIDRIKITNQFEFSQFSKDRNNIFDDNELLDSDLLKIDRRLRYQYSYTPNLDEKTLEKLEYKIALRNLSKIYINTFLVDFDKLLNTLSILNRTKILMVFDEFKVSDCLHFMNKIKDYVVTHNLESTTGIYFRFDNKDDGLKFNKMVTDNKLNSKLNKDSKFVGVSNGKIPKFLLKTDWYPDAVISFTSSLRNNKTDVYCNDCDLIVYYTTMKPLISNVHEIL